MPTYTYVIIDPRGKQKRGSIKAESRENAIQRLKAEGSTVVSVDESGALAKEVSFSFLQKKPDTRDMAVFCRQFVSIINAGVPVVSALAMLSEQTENKKLSTAIEGCKKSIERGETFARAMEEWPEVFPSMLVTMVEAGEASGSLEVSFSRMAEQFEKSAKLKATVKKASIYPIIISLVAIVAVTDLLTLVIPAFEEMLNDLGTELPAITVAVIKASEFMQNWWYIVIAFLVGLIILMGVYKKTENGMHVFGSLALRIPLYKKLVVKTASAQMARTLSTLLAAGLPLMDALEITSGTMTNVHFRDGLIHARDEVGMGSNLSEPIARGGLFPPMVHHMLKIGEETGAVEGMLSKLADYYDDEVAQTTDQVMAVLEPLVILLLALIIGTIVIAVIMPMASMYGGLENL